MKQANHIHDRKITDNTYYYRDNAAHPNIPAIGLSKQSRLDEAARMEKELFSTIEKLHLAIENKEADLANTINSKVKELTGPYARYCA